MLTLSLTAPDTSVPELPTLVKNEVQQIQPIKADGLPQSQEELALIPVEKREPATVQPPSGSHQDWMAAAGINPSDYSYVEFIISHESSWRPNAVNRGSGATGLCQALPAHKMSSAGLDYLTNPVTQLKWCDGYAKARYGGWAKAHSFWQANRWW